MSQLADADARRRIMTEFGTSFFVEAAAGTGKTTALVSRIVGLVRSGAGTLDRIVAVTFTEKAAGELKLRLRSEIEKTRVAALLDERRRLDRALEELELARIGTIHSFCGDLLRERPVEACIDPLFEVAAEEETEALADEAFEAWFQQILADAPEGVHRVLRRRQGGQSPREQLRTAMQTLRDHRDFPERWRRDPFDRNAAIDGQIDALSEIGEIGAQSSWPNDRLAQNLAEIGRFVHETRRIEAAYGRRDYDGLEAALRNLARYRSWGYRGAARTTFGTLSRDEVLSRRDRVKVGLDRFVASADADLAPLLHEALEVPIASYEALKTQSGQLDFLDLLIKARDLVRENAVDRANLQQRFTHFFVDEFQDTDPLQAEILLLLAADDPDETDWRAVRPVQGKLFLVGDPKQSIYRFRRADVALYEEVKDRLLCSGAELLHLTTSFRATPSLQAFVNGAFAATMVAAKDRSQAAYVALRPLRSEIGGQPTTVALPVPRPYGDYGKIVRWRIDESFPDAVGAFVAWLVEQSGWTIEENSEIVPVRPRHIAILFRRFRNFRTDVTRGYVRSLEARRIPHVLVGGRSFHDREEIIALRNALTVIEWPDDELKVFATLRGPFFALSDEALLAFRHPARDGPLRSRRLHPMRAVDRTELDPVAIEVADALALLRRIHLGRNDRPIAGTVAMLLEAVRAHAGIALWPTGEQALANCQRLIDLGRRFEGSASSFRAFVEKLEADAERGEGAEAPVVEEGTEGVRIMTVHKAKGLEFPVVILADPTCNATRDTPGRHVDTARRLWLEPLCGSVPIELREAAEEELRRDAAEAIRVAYVAATRARDLLVVPACGDQPIDGWLAVLDPMVYPPDNLRGQSEPAPGCPTFGEDSVLERGPDGRSPVIGPVRPGLHRSIRAGPPITWWDPAVLVLDAEEQAPLRQQRILEADAEGTAADSERAYASWKEAREALLSEASRPSARVMTATESARLTTNGSGAAASGDIVVERLARDPDARPGGRRFGALVHGILATTDFDAAPQAVSTAAAIQARLVGATEEEVGAAVVVVTRALSHPLLQSAAAAAAAGNLRRETPVILKKGDGILIDGVVDLAFRGEPTDFDGWTVVDFKTDREFEASTGPYLAQVRLYVEAIAEATRLPARGVLLVV